MMTFKSKSKWLAGVLLMLIGISNCSDNVTIPTYTVGGSVSGLDGTLVLTNNGSDDVTITADGAFTFSTALLDAAAFLVEVKTRPSNQNCVVAGGSGTIAAANVTDVTVTCSNKSWTHPADLSDYINPSGTDVDFYYRSVAMDGNGNAIIAWLQSEGTYDQLFVSEYRNGAWVHPSGLTDYVSFPDKYMSETSVAMDNNGDAILAWTQQDASVIPVYQAYKREYRNGSWIEPLDLTDHMSPTPGSTLSGITATMSDGGDALIAWGQSDGVDDQIFKSEYRNAGWTDPSDASDNISLNGQDAGYPKAAIDNDGNVIIAWEQWDGLNWQIFKSEYRNGAWNHPLSLADNISPDGTDAGLQGVAMDDSGNAIIVWTQSNLSNRQVYMSEYRNGIWTPPADLSDHISLPGQSVYSGVGLAMDNNGNAIVAWTQTDGAMNRQAFKSEYRNGTWTHPADLTDNISPDGTSAGATVSTAMDDNGNAIITWIQDDGSNNKIYKSEYRHGAWVDPTNLADSVGPGDDIYDDYAVTSAMGNDGNALIVWSLWDGTNFQLYKSEYR